jgi:hypothetical protein
MEFQVSAIRATAEESLFFLLDAVSSSRIDPDLQQLTLIYIRLKVK